MEVYYQKIHIILYKTQVAYEFFIRSYLPLIIDLSLTWNYFPPLFWYMVGGSWHSEFLSHTLHPNAAKQTLLVFVSKSSFCAVY